MNDEDFKQSELTDLNKGFSSSGYMRAATLLGPANGKAAESIVNLNQAILQVNPEAFLIILDSAKTNNPFDWCSQFARNLRTNMGVLLPDLANFALNTGKSLSPIKREFDADGNTPNIEQRLADTLVKNFEVLIESSPSKNISPHIVLSLNNLREYSDKMLHWLGEVFNPTIRKSKAFKNARFLFSTDQLCDRQRQFFGKFGFEKIHMVEVEPINLKESIPEAPQEENSKQPVPTLSITDEGADALISQKSLKKNTLPVKLGILSKLQTMDIKEAKKILSPFQGKDIEHLFLASYPTRISRYTLAHFETDRNAALAFNWLKRANSLYSVHPSGDLLLNEDLRIAARTIHADQHPELSDRWSTMSQVLDAFHECFPFDQYHWIPINLQLLVSFDQKLLKHLFNEDQVSDVLNFIDHHQDAISENDGKFSINDESKAIIRRYLELSERKCIEGLNDRINEIWLNDNDAYVSKKTKMLEEKENVSAEIEDTLSQVSSLKSLKDDLLDKFRNPKKNRAERIYKFTTSRALLIVGITTIGISLFADSVGSYHAACGLALTFLGFFWPNVELKTSTAGFEGSTSTLAIETQQRSLNHRITSLCNRIDVMKRNLDDVEKHLAKLGDAPPPHYLDSEREA